MKIIPYKRSKQRRFGYQVYVKDVYGRYIPAEIYAYNNRFNVQVRVQIYIAQQPHYSHCRLIKKASELYMEVPNNAR